MPLYEYQCPECGAVKDEFFKLGDKPKTVPCYCGGKAFSILSPGMVLGDDMPAWMRHEQVRGCLQRAGEKPIETRSEYNRYLKKRGIAEMSAKREI